MATAGLHRLNRPWQGLLLLQTTALPSTQQGLLRRRTRWISDEQQARSCPSPPVRLVLSKVRGPRFSEHDKCVIKIKQNSFFECNDPVRLVGTQPECLSSWNEASGPRPSIQVPGDTSRPRTASVPFARGNTHDSLDPQSATSTFGMGGPWRGPRWASWDDGLAALCALKPDLKLNDVDVMVHETILLILLGVAKNDPWAHFNDVHEISLQMAVVDNTLVIKRRSRHTHAVTAVPSVVPRDWEYYEAATDAAPDVEHSSQHYQLLRYKIGPLTCVVRTSVNGTVQKLPKHNGPSRQYQKQDIHGINVIAAGKGVMTPLAFQGSARSHPVHRQGWDFEAKRLEKWVPRLWICGQTRLGLADVLTPRRGVCLGGLTVVDLGELVEKFEEDNQHTLRRLAGLLAKLRDTVRALGSTCVVSISALPPGDPGSASGPTQRYSFDIHSSAKEVPILKDWHKEHFWSQDEAIHARNRPNKSVIRKVVT